MHWQYLEYILQATKAVLTDNYSYNNIKSVPCQTVEKTVIYQSMCITIIFWSSGLDLSLLSFFIYSTSVSCLVSMTLESQPHDVAAAALLHHRHELLPPPPSTVHGVVAASSSLLHPQFKFYCKVWIIER